MTGKIRISEDWHDHNHNIEWSEQAMIRDLIRQNRSYRRFYQEVPMERRTLEELVDLARMSASAANLQPLKYVLVNEPKRNNLVFPHLRWAGYLKDWDGPAEGERPAAYIIVLGDREISTNFFWDHGIACQSILLGACEKGLGGCMLGLVDWQGLRGALKIPDRYELLTVVALGKPKETVVLEEVSASGDVKYWRDARGVHHVPKRKLEEIVLSI
jgi:nitroreductase